MMFLVWNMRAGQLRLPMPMPERLPLQIWSSLGGGAGVPFGN